MTNKALDLASMNNKLATIVKVWGLARAAQLDTSTTKTQDSRQSTGHVNNRNHERS